MTSADAIAAALNALGISSASTSGPTTAFVEWALRGSELRLAWDVEGALDDANANEPFKVVLFDSDQSVVSSESPVSTAPCSDPYLPYQFAGYQGGVGRGYIDHPRLEYPNPATDGFSLTTLIGDLQDLPLNEVCSFSGVNSEKLNGLPWGHYVRVVDVQNAAPQAPLSGGTFQFRPSSDLTAMLLFDQNLNGDATPGDDSSIGVNDPPIPMQNVASDPDIKLGAPADHDNPDGQPD